MNNVFAFHFVLCPPLAYSDIWYMETSTGKIKGTDALSLANEITKLGGCFTIAFYPYNSTKGRASSTLRTIEGCKFRTQLPQDKFSRDSENFFLFEDADGNPKTCYRILIRFISFPKDNGKLRKVEWLKQ